MGTSAFDLTGRRALVTGSARGIGAELAAGLARAGAAIVLHGRDIRRVETAREQLAETLAAQGHSADVAAVAFEVTDAAAVEAGIARLTEDVGDIDILVNNAGMQLRRPLAEFSLSAWETVLSTNLTSAFLVAQQVISGMIDRGSGKIINICSVQTRLPRQTTAPYAVSKSGLAMLTQAMCGEWAAHGIQANGLAPGYIATELNAALLADPEFSAWVELRTPAARWGDVCDLVGPAVWLASRASDFVNGQVIFVDGGMTAVLR